MPGPIEVPRGAPTTPNAPPPASREPDSKATRTGDVRKAAAEGMQRGACIAGSSFCVGSILGGFVTTAGAGVAPFALPALSGTLWEFAKGGATTSIRFEPQADSLAALFGDLVKYGPFVPWLALQTAATQHPVTAGQITRMNEAWKDVCDRSGSEVLRGMRTYPMGKVVTRVASQVAAASTGGALFPVYEAKVRGADPRPTGEDGGVHVGKAVRQAANEPGRLVKTAFFFALTGLVGHAAARKAIGDALWAGASPAARATFADAVNTTALVAAAAASNVVNRMVAQLPAPDPGGDHLEPPDFF